MLNLRGLSMEYVELAQALYQKGYEPIPLPPGKKYPTKKGWLTMAIDLSNWPLGHGVGLRTGLGVQGLDIDVYHEDVVNDLLASLPFPYMTRTGQPPKTLVPICCPDITKKMFSNQWVDANGVVNQIEILSRGQQFVAFGIHPDTKMQYHWSGDFLTHSLPNVSLDTIKELFLCFDLMAKDKGWTNHTRRERKAKKVVSTKPRSDSGNTPGSIYNRSAPVSAVLKHYGWKHFHDQYWTRPGKNKGISASVFDDQILWPFTSSTILDPDRAYDAFELLTQYEFNGDKSACARALQMEIAA
jgi:bifunctional DNA primase/polymerase-like protein